MGRKRRLQFFESGESSSHVGSNEVPSRQQAPSADDDRRQSQGSDDETLAPGWYISKFVLNSMIMKFHSYIFFFIFVFEIIISISIVNLFCFS